MDADAKRRLQERIAARKAAGFATAADQRRAEQERVDAEDREILADLLRVIEPLMEDTGRSRRSEITDAFVNAAERQANR